MEETNILDTLYKARLEKISKMDKDEITMLGDITLRISEYENELEEFLSKFENEDIKIQLRELIAERLEIEYELNSYMKEKFYKFGFADAKNLLMKND